MFAYWLLFSTYAAGAIGGMGRRGSESRSSPIFILAGVLIVVLVGFRYEVGADWTPYAEIYDHVSSIRFRDISTMGDPGYVLLNWIASSLGADIWMVNLVCAIILVWGVIKFSQNQPNPWLTVAVAVPYLIIVVGMGYTRQGVAIGILMAGLVAFERGAIIRFLIYAVIATAFHKSAIIAVPLVVVSAVRHRFIIYAIGAALSILLFMTFLSQFLDGMFANYFESEMSSDGTAIRVAMNVLPALVFLFFSRRFCHSDQQLKLWRNFSLASLAAIPALAILPSSTAVDRLALYMIPLQLFVLGRLPYAFPNKNRPDAVLMILVLLYSATIQFTWLNYAEHSVSWVPYRLFNFFG